MTKEEATIIIEGATNMLAEDWIKLYDLRKQYPDGVDLQPGIRSAVNRAEDRIIGRFAAASDVA